MAPSYRKKNNFFKSKQNRELSLTCTTASMNTRYRTRSRSSSVKTEDEEQALELEVERTTAATAALTVTTDQQQQTISQVSVKLESTQDTETTTLIPPASVVEDDAPAAVPVKEEEDEEEEDEDASYLEDVKGLVYLDDHDGYIDPETVKIELPKCTIDDTVTSVYQCIKCGNKQQAAPDGNIHRMKCLRCYNKAFNKVRPTKWVKFSAK